MDEKIDSNETMANLKTEEPQLFTPRSKSLWTLNLEPKIPEPSAFDIITLNKWRVSSIVRTFMN